MYIYIYIYIYTVVPQASANLYVTTLLHNFVLKKNVNSPCKCPSPSHPFRFVATVVIITF